VATADVTALLKAWAGGEAAAFDRLVPLVHRELHRIARNRMAGEAAGHSLQPTELLHEAYLRLFRAARVDWRDRSHFFATSARLMRRILVDVARSKKYLKRNAGGVVGPLNDATRVAVERAPDLMELDLALAALERIDERKSRVVELRFFCGLSVEETAEALAVSQETVYRDWRLARAWLRRELRNGSTDES
jgi:RNA polymerase sigma factor (TIGR02999 family)